MCSDILKRCVLFVGCIAAVLVCSGSMELEMHCINTLVCSACEG